MAFGWAKVTTEDLGEHIQAFAVAMAELVGVDEVERAGVSLGEPPLGKEGCTHPIFDWEEADDDSQHIIGEVAD